MPCIHNQPMCYGKNKFSQDELKSNPKPCVKCSKILYEEDVFSCIPFIDCVTVIKVTRGSTFKFIDFAGPKFTK